MPLRARALIDQFPSPAAVVEGPDLVYTATSASYRLLLGGIDPAGRPLREVLPALDDGGYLERLDRVYRTGETQSGRGQPARWDADGDGIPEDRFVDFSYSPIRDEAGQIRGILIHVDDATERVRREREMSFLVEASDILSSSLDYETTLASLTDLAVRSIADWCAVDELAPGGALRRIAVAHPDPEKVRLAHELQERYPPDPDAPQGVYHVIRTGEPELLTDIPDELLVAAARDEEHLRIARELGLRSYMCVPLRARGTVLGALTLVAAESGRRYTQEDLRLAELLARRAAIAIDNARLFRESEEARLRSEESAIELEAQAEELQSTQAELEMANDDLQSANEELAVRAEEAERSRAMAEAARERMELLADAGALLASSLELQQTLRDLAQLLVPRVCDWCFVETPDPAGGFVAVAVQHRDPAMVEYALEALERYPVDPEARFGTAQVFRTGEPELVVEIPDEFIAMAARDEGHAEVLRRVGFRSYLSVPLVARGRTLGVLSLVMSDSGRRFRADDLPFAQELARRAATAIDNAGLYEAERRARNEAEEANRAKTEFLSAMSHELRTPLNAIAGYVDVLDFEIHGPLTPQQRESLTRIKRNQEILLGLISDVLNFARVEAGRIELSSGPVPIEPLLEGLEQVIGPQVRGQGLTYRQEVAAPGLAAYGDADRIQQILLNLLTNAVKFTDPGGAITVHAEGVDGTVVIRVSDTGRGIPADKLEAIFDPFVQVDRHRTDRSQQGVGLGLAISRDLARAMGGDLRAESVPEEGSTFTVILPRAR